MTALAQALARHKAAQAAIDAHFGSIDDDALATNLSPPRETLSRPWPKRLAVTRWQNFTGQTATLEATGEAFESKGVSAIGVPPSE